MLDTLAVIQIVCTSAGYTRAISLPMYTTAGYASSDMDLVYAATWYASNDTDLGYRTVGDFSALGTG